MPKRSPRIPAPALSLSRRERQVMDILFRQREATASEVMTELPDPPTYSSVRSILSILVEKGHITRREEGLRYVYSPKANTKDVREEALKHVISTFFNGSANQTIAAVLRISDTKLSDADVARLEGLIRKARANEEEP